MKAVTLFAVVLLLLSAVVRAQPPAEIQQVCVPPLAAFDALLHRDLLAYFRSSGAPTATGVTYQILGRDPPAQFGVVCPKYYLWARVSSGSAQIAEGAVRVTTVEGNRFEVTAFMSKSAIQAAPTDVGSVFPATLVPAILSLAGVR